MRKGLATLVVVTTVLFSANTHAQFAACTIQNRSLTDAGTDPFNHVRVAVRQDGRPLLAYTSNLQSVNSSALYAYDCDDAACSSGHPIHLDTSTNYFGAPGIVIRNDGLPAIVAGFFGGLRYYDCADADCADVTDTDLRDQENALVGEAPIALQLNGNPAILYVDGKITVRPGYLILRFCADVGCVADGTEKVLAMPASQSEFSGLSLAIGSDGIPAATYLASQGANNTYNIAHCSDAACTAVVNSQISAPVGNSTPVRSGVAIRSDLRPLAIDSQAQNRALLDCANVGCTAANNALLPSSAIGTPVGLKLLAGDRPAFALFNALSVGAYACATAACTSGAAVQVASAATSILDADFAVDSASYPAMAYIDQATSDVGIARCVGDIIFVDGFDTAR
jgi:hypothetical protein